jgi:hypothetical protein
LKDGGLLVHFRYCVELISTSEERERDKTTAFGDTPPN